MTRADRSVGDWQCPTERETAAVAGAVADMLSPSDCLLLFGPMGIGKTTFVRHLAAAMGLDARQVQSPTFSLVHEIGHEERRLIHLDLYRLGEADFDSFGLLELLEGDGIKAVEWAERLPQEWWPRGTMLIELSDAGEGRRRIRATVPAPESTER